MKILALVPSLYDTSPGQRFRLEQWEPWLKREGLEVRYEAFESPQLHAMLYGAGRFTPKLRAIARDFGRRLRLTRSLAGVDAVYIFRESAILGPAVVERWIHRRGIPYVFDFDDAVFVTYISPSNGCLSLLKCARKARTSCRLASHVMAGNSYLAEYARRYNDAVTIIPTTIDTVKYQPRPGPARTAPLTIGWSGSHSTVMHLDLLRGALERLATREKFRLRVIGTGKYSLPGVEGEATPWKSATEVDDLLEFDIGIMPLPDDRWSRGKCGLKALQYMALGIPTVCSPVGVNREIIEDGENGFLADGEADWLDKLSRLLHSPALRMRLASAGRATVESRYSAQVQAPRVGGIFSSLRAHMAACRPFPAA